MQIQRLYNMTNYLLANRMSTAAELAQRFDVSIRTVFRDIDVLSSAGIPVYTSQGTGGGIFIDDHFVLSRTTLTNEEQKRILLSLSSLTITGQEDFRFLLEKLTGLFQNQPSEMIEVDFSRWGRREEDQAVFNKIISAISSNQMLSFSYVNMNMARSNKTVCPIKLLYKSQAWYLKGYCQEKLAHRTFKIHRMSKLKIEEAVFDPADLSARKADREDQVASVNIPLVLKCSAAAAHRLYEDFHESQFSLEEDGSCVLQAEVPDTPWLYGFILSFGSEAEVIEPQSLRNRIRQIAKELVGKYEDG